MKEALVEMKRVSVDMSKLFHLYTGQVLKPLIHTEQLTSILAVKVMK